MIEIHKDISIEMDSIVAVVKNSDERLEGKGMKVYHNALIFLENNSTPIVYSSEDEKEIDQICINIKNYKGVI